MLDQLQRNLIPSDRPSPPPDGAATTIDLDAVLAAARRQYKVIVGTSIAAVLLAIGYIIAATPIFTSTADILMDSRQFGADRHFSRPGEPVIQSCGDRKSG